jgi:hypothetical protein
MEFPAKKLTSLRPSDDGARAAEGVSRVSKGFLQEIEAHFIKTEN